MPANHSFISIRNHHSCSANNTRYQAALQMCDTKSNGCFLILFVKSNLCNDIRINESDTTHMSSSVSTPRAP